MDESVKKGIRNGIIGAVIGFSMTFIFLIKILKEFPPEDNYGPFFVWSMVVLGALKSALYNGIFVFAITIIFYYFKSRKKQN